MKNVHDSMNKNIISGFSELHQEQQ